MFSYEETQLSDATLCRKGEKQMANVLYITANPYDETRSYSMAVGKVFIESYKELHPQDRNCSS